MYSSGRCVWCMGTWWVGVGRWFKSGFSCRAWVLADGRTLCSSQAAGRKAHSDALDYSLTFRLAWVVGVPWEVMVGVECQGLVEVWVAGRIVLSHREQGGMIFRLQCWVLPYRHSSQVMLPRAVLLSGCRGNDVNPCVIRVTLFFFFLVKIVSFHPFVHHSFLLYVVLPPLPRPCSLLQAPHSHRSSWSILHCGGEGGRDASWER